MISAGRCESERHRSGGDPGPRTGKRPLQVEVPQPDPRSPGRGKSPECRSSILGPRRLQTQPPRVACVREGTGMLGENVRLEVINQTKNLGLLGGGGGSGGVRETWWRWGGSRQGGLGAPGTEDVGRPVCPTQRRGQRAGLPAGRGSLELRDWERTTSGSTTLSGSVLRPGGMLQSRVSSLHRAGSRGLTSLGAVKKLCCTGRGGNQDDGGGA